MRFAVPFFDTHSSAALAAAPALADKFGATPAAEPGSLRILHILRAPLGGLFRHVCDLVEEQTRMGHQVGIICDSGTGGDSADEKLTQLQQWCSLGIVRIPMSRTLSLRDVATITSISRLVAKVYPDVIHGHGAKGGAYARLLPRAKGRTVLYTPHGGSLHYSWKSPAGALFLGLERLLMPRTDGILFESQFGQATYTKKIGRASCPVRVIANGLNQKDFVPPPSVDTDYDAVFVGELRELKGVGTLIEAAARMSRYRSVRIAIAGTGPDEKRFRALAAALGIKDSIDFVGHRPAREVFARARTIVIPSLAESFPYIVLEAIASGRNVIATNVGGIPEIFGPEAAALLPPGDAEALEKAILETMEPTLQSVRRRLALRDRAKSLYSAPRMARDITRFYADLQSREEVYARETGAGPVKCQETKTV